MVEVERYGSYAYSSSARSLGFDRGFWCCCVCLRVVSLLIKAPAAAGAFYFFNSPTNPINQPPIPDTITPLNIMNDLNKFLC